MKKILSLALIAILIFSTFVGCTSTGGTVGEDKLSVVVTIFPEYDWVREILGDRFENFDVTMLLDNGVDLHSYQPTADDIIKISSCDLFVYVGGESDEWVEDALKTAGGDNIKTVNLIETLGDKAKTEEAVNEIGDNEDDDEIDEHIWLSLKNAEYLVNEISTALQDIDPKNKTVYADNTQTYIEKLSALDSEYISVVSSAKYKTLLFGDRFPFRYLADDYGLTYYAAFSGCSAESEADFETVSFLAEKVDELGLPCVLCLEGTEHTIAETVVQSTKTKDQTVLTMDSMQSTTLKDVKNGVTYVSIMEKNLAVLKTALN